MRRVVLLTVCVLMVVGLSMHVSAHERITLCHELGNGDYMVKVVPVSAESGHRGHGDGAPGEIFPGEDGPYVFTDDCSLVRQECVPGGFSMSVEGACPSDLFGACADTTAGYICQETGGKLQALACKGVKPVSTVSCSCICPKPPPTKTK